MKSVLFHRNRSVPRETLTEAYEVRAFRDEGEQTPIVAQEAPALAEEQRPEPGALQAAKARVGGHGEQQVVPDDCQFGDNDLCNPEK